MLALSAVEPTTATCRGFTVTVTASWGAELGEMEEGVRGEQEES